MENKRRRGHSIAIDHPTAQWVEGLPLGNGDVGAMLYGGPERLTVALNKSDIWDYRVEPGQGLPEEVTFDRLMQIVHEQNWKEYERLFASYRRAFDSPRPSLQTCGQLDLELWPGERVLEFGQLLELDTATTSARLACEDLGSLGAKSLELTAFVPARDVLVPLTVTANAPLWGTLRLWRQSSPDYDPPTAWRQGEVAGIDMGFGEGVASTVAARVLAAGRWEMSESQALYLLTPSPAPALVLLTIVSSLEHADTRREARERLEAATGAAAERLQAAHRAWWAEFWSRSDISLPDETLERHWRIGLYAFGSCSRPGKKAPGLQGVWNRYNRPCWHTDYHADMNIQMNYWPAYASNHLDLVEPLERLYMVEMREECRRMAREFFRRRGLYVPMAGGPRGEELGGPWFWPGAGAWVCQMLWWHFLYSQDQAVLASIYDFLKEASLFYEDMLSRDQKGIYHVGPSFPPELMDPRAFQLLGWGRDSTADLAFIRLLLGALVEASERLDRDSKERERWRGLRDHLAPYPCGIGQFLDMEGTEWETLGPMNARIMPLYPVGEIGLGSPPELLSMVRRGYRKIRPLFDNAGHHLTWLAAAAAHLGQGEEACELLHDFVNTTILPNGMQLLRVIPHNRLGDRMNGVLQIEATISFANAVNEMLLQSLDGVIRVFPGAPRGWSAEFWTLRAVGAFLVSARVEEGRVAWVRVASERGVPCRIADPWGEGVALLDAGDGSPPKKIHAAASGVLTFATTPGARYAVSPPGAS